MATAKKIKTRWYGYYIADGKRRSAGGADTREEALNLAKDQEYRLRHGVWTDPADGRMPLRAYVEQKWFPAKKHSIKLNSQIDYMYRLNSYVLPTLGDMPIGQIQHGTIVALLAELRNAGKRPHTVTGAYRVLRIVLKAAVVDKVIPADPTSAIKTPKARKRRVEILDEETDQFEAAVAELDMKWQLFIILLLETGARFSEVRAIRGRHLNPLRSRVTICEQVLEAEKSKVDEFFNPPREGYQRIGERWYLEPSTKTGDEDDPGEREITIDREVMKLLTMYITQQGLGPDDLIFTTTGRGKNRGLMVPIGRSNFHKAIWLPTLEKAQLSRHLRIHDLRHTAISLALAGGAALADVMKMAGHKQLATTQLYTHTTDDAPDNVAAARKRARERRRAS